MPMTWRLLRIISTTFAVSYGLSFASITATVVHALIYFYRPIKRHFGQSLREQPDIHAQLMARYRQGVICISYYLLAVNTDVDGMG